jgi:hypothetical protein
MDAEADLVGFAWQLPWEKERQERLIAQGNQAGYNLGGGRRDVYEQSPFRGLPGVEWAPHTQSGWTSPAGGFVVAEGLVQTDRRAARILIALRRYELEHGKPPEALTALVDDGFLLAVPLDPFATAPFGYRLSAGERIEMETRTEPPAYSRLSESGVEYATVLGAAAAHPLRYGGILGHWSESSTWPLDLPAGRPVLWGVGPDRRNGGGVELSTVGERGRDRVYLPAPVPPEESP